MGSVTNGQYEEEKSNGKNIIKYERNTVIKNVQENDFCTKMDQIVTMSNMLKNTMFVE